MGELGLLVLPSTVAIPSIQTSGITETGCTNPNDTIDINMKKLCGELEWYVTALEAQKTTANGVPKSIMASWELISA